MNREGNMVNRDALLARFEGDEELLGEIVAIFLEDHERQLREIRESIERHDGRALEAAAHALKGSIGNFGVEEARDATYVLERLGAEMSFDRAPEAYDHLLDIVGRVTAELREMTDRAA